jgi:hypothetical protein
VQQQQLKQQIEATINRFIVQFAVMQNHFDKLTQTLKINITQIAVQPPRMANAVQGRQHNIDCQVVEEQQQVAELSKSPRNLFDRWAEYQTGIGGLKPAKDFTPTKQGWCKIHIVDKNGLGCYGPTNL